MSAPLDPWAAIEPAALPVLNRRFDRPGEHDIELSKAISLKRIADVLEGSPQSTGLIMALHNLERGQL